MVSCSVIGCKNRTDYQNKDISYHSEMASDSILQPAPAGEFIAARAEHVQIHVEGLDAIAEQILGSMRNRELEIPDPGADSFAPSKDDPRAVDWVFVADALNFCFWARAGAEQWTVDGHAGYFALEAALRRALKEGVAILDPQYYSEMSIERLLHLMRGDNGAVIPLPEERVRVLREVGRVLLQRWGGSFARCVEAGGRSAVRLLQLVVREFPSFRDEALYLGRRVGLYKRAQILVADLWSFFGGAGAGEFGDVGRLSMFADYRVPQVLLHFGALSYSPELLAQLRRDEPLESGCAREVEIRGCSIHAVELLRKRVAEEVRRRGLDVALPNSCQIDFFLWCYRRKHAEQMEKIPFHKTLGIFY